jgi:hypothetical protein
VSSDVTAKTTCRHSHGVMENPRYTIVRLTNEEAKCVQNDVAFTTPVATRSRINRHTVTGSEK